MDEDETYVEKMDFETPNGVIGREFENVIYITPSYICIKDQRANDVLHSNLLTVCSRPKIQLLIIDIGRNETEKVHKEECLSLFTKHTSIQNWRCDQFMENKSSKKG